MMRDKIGSFTSRSECERWLNQWIVTHATPDDTASASVKAEKPLRDARIEVVDVPGQARRLSRCRIPAAALPIG